MMQPAMQGSIFPPRSFPSSSITCPLMESARSQLPSRWFRVGIESTLSRLTNLMTPAVP